MKRDRAYLPRSPAAEGGGGGVLTAAASQVDVALQLLVTFVCAIAALASLYALGRIVLAVAALQP